MGVVSGKSYHMVKHKDVATSVTDVLRSQSLNVLSQDPERANCPSLLITTSDTKWLWPWRLRLAIP